MKKIINECNNEVLDVNFIGTKKIFEVTRNEFTQSREEELVSFMEKVLEMERDSFALNLQQLGATDIDYNYSLSTMYIKKCQQLLK